LIFINSPDFGGEHCQLPGGFENLGWTLFLPVGNVEIAVGLVAFDVAHHSIRHTSILSRSQL